MAVNNSLAKRAQAPGITTFLNRMDVLANIDQALGRDNRQRFITGVISAVNNNSALSDCSKTSILSGALLGESLKLSPSPQLGHYYLVPFNDKDNGKVAQFQLGYKGYIQLAIRSGQYKKLNVLAIKAGELVRFDPLNEEIEVRLIEDEEARELAETIGYYATFELVNGFKKSIYWSKKQMENHAQKYSPGYRAKKGYTFWEKNFDGMAYKTMLRQLISKWGIMSIDMVSAMDADMAVINDDGTKDYVENEEETIDAEAYAVEPEMPTEPQTAEPDGYGVQQALFGNR